MLVGTFLLGYGLARFFVEFFREPDIQLGTLSWGLTMGQTLTLPMIAGGIYLIATAGPRASGKRAVLLAGLPPDPPTLVALGASRSEEPHEGKDCASTCN